MDRDHGFDRAAIQSYLLVQTALGDHASFRQLHRQTEGMITGLVCRIQPNNAQAQEIVQEVFLKVWSAAGDFDPAKGKPSTWLGKIARNTALDSLRRQGTRPKLSTLMRHLDDESDPMDRLVSSRPGPSEIASLRADGRVLCLCMSQLPHAHQQSLALAYFHDMSHVEVAQRMGQPLGTVKSWVRRSLITLKACVSLHGVISNRRD